MAITTEQKYLLNHMNAVAAKVGLGDLIEAAESVVASEIALASAKVLVGNGSGIAAAVDLSGDVTIDNTGAVTIGAAKVGLTNLKSGVAPSHIAVKGELYTTTGGNAAEDVTLSGVLATDIVVATLHTPGTNTVTLSKAVAGSGKITLTFSADPGNDAKVNYVVFRAAS